MYTSLNGIHIYCFNPTLCSVTLNRTKVYKYRIDLGEISKIRHVISEVDSILLYYHMNLFLKIKIGLLNII